MRDLNYYKGSPMAKHLMIFAILLLLGGCKHFENQVPIKAVLLEKELQSIDWTEVDEYPSVEECYSIADKDARRQCFINYLINAIQQRIASDTLTIRYPELDTINVKVTVFPDSTVTFEPEIGKNVYKPELIDSLIRTRLANFPKVSPALKRGMPVKTQFNLPVILNIEEN